MKKSFLLLVTACFWLAGVFAQTGAIENLQVAQRTDGSGLVDIHFDLNGAGASYNLQFEASFDDGANYEPLSETFLTGELTNVLPGTGKHIIWAGKASHPETFSTQTRVRVIAIEYIPPTVPTVITSEITEVTTTSATTGGNVTDDGGAPVTARGVVWSTTPNPTLEENDGFTNDGEGLGEFESEITGLQPETNYYVRAYAENSVGVGYGEELSYSTIAWQCGDEFVDSRDGQRYATVQIGEQCWMAENLKYLPYVVGPDVLSTTEPYYYVYDYHGNDVNVAKSTYSFEIFGAMYNRLAALNSCPQEWKLPSDDDFCQLVLAIDETINCNDFGHLGTYAGGKMKSTGNLQNGTGLWNSPNTGATNESGFNGLPGGYLWNGFNYLGSIGDFWSSTENDNTGIRWTLSHDNETINRNSYPTYLGYSVRCLMVNNNPSNQPPSPPTNPSPETGSINKPINLSLTWSCSDPEGDPLNYDVYFGIDENPQLAISGISEQTYTPATLEYNTTYFWKIVAHDDQGNTTEGEVWNFTTIAQLPDYVPNDGLIGWWPFEGNANDHSGNGHHGIVTSAELTFDRKGNPNAAFLFEQSANAQIEFNIGTRICNEFTFMLWVKPNRDVSVVGESSSCNGGTDVPMAYSQNWVMPAPHGQADSLGIGLSLGTNGAFSAEHAANIITGRLCKTRGISDIINVALIYRPDSAFLYLDGELARVRAMYCASNTKFIDSTLIIGSTVLYSPSFDGIIDDVGLWNRPLTQNEILTLFSEGINLSPLPPSNPSPETGSINQTITPTLTWDCADPEGDPLTYDVYFGTDENPPLAVSGISEQSYSPAALEYSTIYNWKVVAHDDQGNSKEGEFWSFGTEIGDYQPCPGAATVIDIDGNVYNTVKIGNQCWMKENLKTTKDADGNSITRYCYQNNTDYCDWYGGLYMWETVMNGSASSNNNPSGVLGICPTGWHVPSRKEWIQLVDYAVALGFPNSVGVLGAGNALKSCRQVNSQQGGVCNTSLHPRWNLHFTYFGFDALGFSALPGGYYKNILFDYLGSHGFWWSATEYTSSSAWRVINGLYYNPGLMGIDHIEKSSYGYSIRCLRDKETSSNLPPLKSYNPSPETGSINQTITPTLTWDCSDPEGDPLFYDVYFGTNETPPLAVSGISEQSYSLATLEYSTTYFWKIVAHDDQGNTTEGEVWSFTTLPQPEWQCGDLLIDDRDGNEYPTVQIGSQCWMAKNLDYLPEVSPPSEGSATDPFYYVYGFQGTDVNTAKTTANYQNYGVLYNWPASLTACPVGWHLPADTEWVILLDYVVSQGYPNQSNDPNGAGNALKSCRQENSPLGGFCNTSEHPRWHSNSTTHGFDEFGLSALPGGGRFDHGATVNIGLTGIWWTHTANSETNAWGYSLNYSITKVSRDDLYKELGSSARCLKD